MQFVPLWTSIIDEPCWKILDLPAELYRYWTFCLMAAQKHDHIDGNLPDERTLARWFGMDRIESSALLARLVAAGLIDREEGRHRMHDWDEWRVVKDPGAKDRQRKRRAEKRAERDRNGTCHGPVTVASRACSIDVAPYLTSCISQLPSHTPPNPPEGDVGAGEDLEPFDPGGPAELPPSKLPPDKQRVLDRQTQRWGASNGDRVVGDLLADYSAEIVRAACDHHYADNHGSLDPARLLGICRAMQAGKWKLPAKGSPRGNEPPPPPKIYGAIQGP